MGMNSMSPEKFYNGEARCSSTKHYFLTFITSAVMSFQKSSNLTFLPSILIDFN